LAAEEMTLGGRVVAVQRLRGGQTVEAGPAIVLLAIVLLSICLDRIA